MSLCVFTFNSFCRPGLAQHSSTATPRFNTISNETQAPLSPPPRPVLCSNRERRVGRLTTSELGKKKRGASQTFQPSLLPFPLSRVAVGLPSLPVSFFLPSRAARRPSTPTVCPTLLYMDRNSEKLIFLRRFSAARSRTLLLPLPLSPLSDLYLLLVYSVAQLWKRRKRVFVGPSGSPSARVSQEFRVNVHKARMSDNKGGWIC